MAIATVAADSVAGLLEGLLGRETIAKTTPAFEPHPATLRGLVADDNDLVAVIGSELKFAHLTGACLAMIPRGRAEGAGDKPDEDLIEVYTEVANVFSRLVNEASSRRVRLDPDIDHEPEALSTIVSSGSPLVLAKADIENYGIASVGVWLAAEGWDGHG